MSRYVYSLCPSRGKAGLVREREQDDTYGEAVEAAEAAERAKLMRSSVARLLEILDETHCGLYEAANTPAALPEQLCRMLDRLALERGADALEAQEAPAAGGERRDGDGL
jgi:hypothetical protein